VRGSTEEKGGHAGVGSGLKKDIPVGLKDKFGCRASVDLSGAGSPCDCHGEGLRWLFDASPAVAPGGGPLPVLPRPLDGQAVFFASRMPCRSATGRQRITCSFYRRDNPVRRVFDGRESPSRTPSHTTYFVTVPKIRSYVADPGNFAKGARVRLILGTITLDATTRTIHRSLFRWVLISPAAGSHLNGPTGHRASRSGVRLGRPCGFARVITRRSRSARRRMKWFASLSRLAAPGGSSGRPPKRPSSHTRHG